MIWKGLWLVIADVLHSQELEDLEQELSVMSECNSSMMWISLFYEYMAVEAAHLTDGEHSYAPKDVVLTGSTSPSAI